MKVRIIEGEPARMMSGAFLHQDLSGHDAVVIIKNQEDMKELVWALAEDLSEPMEETAGE